MNLVHNIKKDYAWISKRWPDCFACIYYLNSLILLGLQMDPVLAHLFPEKN